MCMSRKVLGVKKGRKGRQVGAPITTGPPDTMHARTLDAFPWESLRSPFGSALDAGLLHSIQTTVSLFMHCGTGFFVRSGRREHHYSRNVYSLLVNDLGEFQSQSLLVVRSQSINKGLWEPNTRGFGTCHCVRMDPVLFGPGGCRRVKLPDPVGYRVRRGSSLCHHRIPLSSPVK